MGLPRSPEVEDFDGDRNGDTRSKALCIARSLETLKFPLGASRWILKANIRGVRNWQVALESGNSDVGNSSKGVVGEFVELHTAGLQTWPGILSEPK